MNTHPLNWKKYVLVFLITAIIFGTALYVSDYFSEKKIDEIKSIQDQIALDILSSETQFSLLEQSSCADNGGSTSLSTDLGTLEDKLLYAEQNQGNSAEIKSLKEYYSLLEIKDFLLMQQISQKCHTKPLSIIYFYSTDNCDDCQKEGYVLTDLRNQYPDLRVYSFDYNLDISAVKTLIAMNTVTDKLPAIIINGKVYYGFQSENDIEKNAPALLSLKTATSTSIGK